MEFQQPIGVLSKSSRLQGCEGIRVDLTGNCNLRCPYCINDFSQVQGNTLMTPQLLDKVVTLFPLLRPNGRLLFSCYFEPTIHPQFLDLLSRVPCEWRNRGGFTTNLARRLPDSFFERLVQLRVGYINVSIDSLNPAVFEEMRKGIRFDVFKGNLERLVNFCSHSQDAPEIRFISMVSKLNLAEIPDHIGRCSELYKPKRHEIRGIWMTPEIEQRSWIQNQAIAVEDFLQLRQRLSALPPHVDLVFDLPANPEAFTRFPAKTERGFGEFVRNLKDPELKRAYTVPVAPILQIASDGVVRFLIAEPDFRLDLKSIDDPAQIVGQLLVLQNLNVARASLVRKSTLDSLALRRINLLNGWLAKGELKLIDSPEKPVGHVDELPDPLPGSSLPGQAWISGWARNPRGTGPAEEVVLAARHQGKRRIIAVAVPEYERVDVALNLADARLLYSGWTLEIDPELVSPGQKGPTVLEAYAFDSATRTGYRFAGEHDASTAFKLRAALSTLLRKLRLVGVKADRGSCG